MGIPRSIRSLLAAAALVLAAGAVVAPAAVAHQPAAVSTVAVAGAVDDAAAALRSGESVYVDPAASDLISSAEADQLRAQIRDSNYPFYVAVLPRSATIDGWSLERAISWITTPRSRSSSSWSSFGRPTKSVSRSTASLTRPRASSISANQSTCSQPSRRRCCSSAACCSATAW